MYDFGFLAIIGGKILGAAACSCETSGSITELKDTGKQVMM